MMQSLNRIMLSILSGYKKQTPPRVKILCLLFETKKEYTISELKREIGKSDFKRYDYLRRMLIELSDAGWIKINKAKRPYTFKIENKSILLKKLFCDKDE